MELFSKRNAERLRYGFRHRAFPGTFTKKEPEKEGNFLTPSLRNRLHEQLRYIVESNVYLESFLTAEDPDNQRVFLNAQSLRALSLRELGYAVDEILDPYHLTFSKSEYRDVRFFDLIEILIIFSKSDKRQSLIDRFNEVFEEEWDDFVVRSFMIVERQHTGLQSIVPLIKDRLLKEKIYELADIHTSVRSTHEAMARLSADILQLLFSSPTAKGDTKKFSENLCNKLATRWTSKENVNALSELLSATVKNAKDLGNQIANIRHTDQHTIRVESPSFYRLIAHKNKNLIELVILSLPDDYLIRQEPDDLKAKYLSQFNVDKDKQTIHKPALNPEPDPDPIPYPEETINPEDIPF